MLSISDELLQRDKVLYRLFNVLFFLHVYAVFNRSNSQVTVEGLSPLLLKNNYSVNGIRMSRRIICFFNDNRCLPMLHNTHGGRMGAAGT